MKSTGVASCSGVNARTRALEIPVVPLHDLSGSGGLVRTFWRFHLEVHIGDAVQKLDVGVGEVPGKFARIPRAWVWTIFALVVGNSADDSFGGLNFPLKAIEHHVAIGSGKFGCGRRHEVLLRAGLSTTRNA